METIPKVLTAELLKEAIASPNNMTQEKAIRYLIHNNLTSDAPLLRYQNSGFDPEKNGTSNFNLELAAFAAEMETEAEYARYFRFCDEILNSGH